MSEPMRTSPSACIKLKEGTHAARVVLMPGDPLRAKYIAETYLEKPVLFNDVRSMFGYTGFYEGREVSVMGSGMGVPSMCLYAHELFSFFGVDASIRVGSAGAVADDVRVRDVVLAMSASTNSAAPSAYDLPGNLTPHADYAMLKTAEAAAEELGIRTRTGNVYTSDFFYHPSGNINTKIKATGHLCVEMETAGLYLEAMNCGKRALSVLSISDHIFTGEMLTPEEIREGFNDMMVIALKTAVRTF